MPVGTSSDRGLSLFAALLLVAATATATAEQPKEPSRSGRQSPARLTPLNVRFESVPVERITLGGAAAEEGAVADGAVAACATVTYVDPAIFDQGTFAIQAGFTEGETAYAVFSVPPESFPIRLETIEAIFAQSTNVATRTEWSLIIWDGPPVAGQGIQLYSFSSLDGLLPALEMQIGLHATNLQVTVDPDDPEQLLISNDSGRNMFSVGYRIDEHNDPSILECFIPPPPNSNAFPTTDTDGVFAPTGNYLAAINCGNPCDGTNSFAELPQVCRPSGDWVIRASYGCTLFGPCCDVNGTCIPELDDASCVAQGGTFMGEGLTCGEVTCPTPVGACCFGSNCLIDVEESLCESLSTGVYMGNGVDCSPTLCEIGACCLPSGDCLNRVEIACGDLGGTWHGGANCSSFSCPQPRGACCIQGLCFANQPRNTCEAVGSFMGIGSTCVPDPCQCPAATILGAQPPHGTVDARQPHDPDQPAQPQGIGSALDPIVISLGAAGAETCFDLCETATGGLSANDIATVTDLGGGVYRITLDRPITAGAVTTIRYIQDNSFVRYISHPANVNADGGGNINDIVAMLALLQGTALPVHGDYSCDLDHSGSLAPADLVRLVDLLNGGGAFNSWNNTNLPVNGPCP